MKSMISFCRLAFFVILVGIGVMTVGCGDSPTGPTTPKNYKVYFVNHDRPYWYYYFQTGAGIVDSFTLPYPSDNGIAISPDGSTMYIVTGTAIILVDTKTEQVVREYPPVGEGDIVLSPDGRYLAITGGGGPKNHLLIVSTADFQIIYRDTIYTAHGSFAKDGKHFYCAAHTGNMPYYAYILDMHRGYIVSKKQLTGGQLYSIIPNYRGDRLHVLFQIYGELFSYRVYDSQLDSTLFDLTFCPGYGEMAIDNQEQCLVLSQAGSMFGDCPTPSYFTIFDIRKNAIEDQISTSGILGPDHYAFFPVGEICFTPDGRHLIGARALVGGDIFDYNMETRKFEYAIDIGHPNKAIFSLTCQSSP
jgi:WD40 repeat protein